MKIGCCAKLEEYEQVSNAGFDYVEFAGKIVAALEDDAFDQLCTKVKNGPIPCLALNAYCAKDVVIAGPGFDSKKARTYAKNLADRAHKLGVKVVNIGSPNSRILPQDYDRNSADKEIRQFYRVTADEFAKYGIVVTVESLGLCYCNFINKLHEAVQIVKDVSTDNLKMVLDFYNMQQSGEEDADISPALPYLCHVHDSDDAGSPLQRSFFAADKMPVHAAHIRQLISLGYDGTVSIEVDVPFHTEDAKKCLNLIRTVLI